MAVSAGNICVVGGYSSQSNSDISPLPDTGCDPLVDPIAASFVPPSVGSCDHTSRALDNSSATLSPGTYCGGLSITGNSNVTLNPGTYIIKDARIFIDSNSDLTGSGVFIYLTNGAYVDFHSNSTITLSAPTSGTYEGFLLAAQSGNDLTQNMDSNNYSSFDGLIYFPGDKFAANSNASVPTGAGFRWLIAKTFYLDSNAHLLVDPTGAVATPPPLAGGSVALVK